MKLEYLFFAVFISLLSIIFVSAYGTSNPPIFGHSANEIEGINNTSIGPYYNIQYFPITYYQNTNVSGNISTGDVYTASSQSLEIPLNATEVFLALSYTFLRNSYTSAEFKFKYPGQTTWKVNRLDAASPANVMSNKQYFQIPLDSQGKLEWEINHFSPNSNISVGLSIGGYR